MLVLIGVVAVILVLSVVLGFFLSRTYFDDGGVWFMRTGLLFLGITLLGLTVMIYLKMKPFGSPPPWSVIVWPVLAVKAFPYMRLAAAGLTATGILALIMSYSVPRNHILSQTTRYGS